LSSEGPRACHSFFLSPITPSMLRCWPGPSFSLD
jgi:hypothetical protein